MLLCCYQSGVGLGGVLFTFSSCGKRVGRAWRGVPLSFGSHVTLRGGKIVVKPGKNSHLWPANENYR